MPIEIPVFKRHFNSRRDFSHNNHTVVSQVIDDHTRLRRDPYTGLFYGKRILARVGKVVFVDNNSLELLPAKNHHSIVIPLNDMDRGEFAKNDFLYAQLMVEEIMGISQEIKSSGFLDLGCGEGPLALLAYKLGAKHVVGIDNNLPKLRRFLRNVNNNGYEKARFTYVHGDIRTIAKYGLDLDTKVKVVCENIGPHSQFGSAHLAGITLLERLPDAAYFIGGGYYSFGQGLRGFTLAQKGLAKRGFKVIDEVRWTIPQGFENAGEDLIAFTAKKN